MARLVLEGAVIGLVAALLEHALTAWIFHRVGDFLLQTVLLTLLISLLLPSYRYVEGRRRGSSSS